MLNKRRVTGMKRHHLAEFHPAKGSVIKVEPIRKKKDIDTIKKMLENHSRSQVTGISLLL